MNIMEKQKFEIVKKHIDELDYMSLLSLGCPKNEYDGESEKIAKRINSDMSPEEIALLIDNVFTESFCTGVDMSNPYDPKEIKIDEKKDYNVYISERILKIAKRLCYELKNRIIYL